MMYDINTDKPKDLIPMLNLSQVFINDVPYNPFKPIVLPYDKYKIQFDFVGLQYSNPAAVSYQYQLLGYDKGWTSFSKSNTAYYPRVEHGDFSFWVKACNSENCTEETMLFTIKIRKPYYLTSWFALLAISAIIGLGYVIIAIRERNHRILQEYLENELKARTREVRKQKEEIEVKNRDITDSINYAQRIQFSVLPSTSTLLEHCSGAFIFYRPRDIVSGDFYWFDYFPQNNRLLIVCADSTGHGVPGAFMSLIGTTLIKDIAIRSEVLNPADILYRLDENVQSTLNQNRDSEQANDGMDIIVCEINTETYIAKISSAMRPYVIYHKGTPTTYKSSRSSIGGQYVENKVFNTHEIQLLKGDTIYMFTDGYTDQFGGPSGKKLKMNRLQNILDDIHNRNIDEQYRVVKENFDLWKGHNPQVDDVLMIGVKI
jgi:serine phosphatase RsbU (regulator of sigma subunit)